MEPDVTKLIINHPLCVINFGCNEHEIYPVRLFIIDQLD